MIFKFNYVDFDKVKKEVSERRIKYLKILKNKEDYYVEYKTCSENNSEKLIDLLSIINEFEYSMKNNTLTNFYLFYDVEVDYIINNISTLVEYEDKPIMIDANVEVYNDLLLLKNKIKKSTLSKTTLAKGKKKYTATFEEIIDNLIEEAKKYIISEEDENV